MKFPITIILTIFTLTVFSKQTDSLDILSNSFKESYRKSNSTLTYSSYNISQIHNYSNNWDFDKDGIKDELYFVGTGGAHLYYFLKVVLSSAPKESSILKNPLFQQMPKTSGSKKSPISRNKAFLNKYMFS